MRNDEKIEILKWFLFEYILCPVNKENRERVRGKSIKDMENVIKHHSISRDSRCEFICESCSHGEKAWCERCSADALGEKWTFPYGYWNTVKKADERRKKSKEEHP